MEGLCSRIRVCTAWWCRYSNPWAVSTAISSRLYQSMYCTRSSPDELVCDMQCKNELNPPAKDLHQVEQYDRRWHNNVIQQKVSREFLRLVKGNIQSTYGREAYEGCHVSYTHTPKSANHHAGQSRWLYPSFSRGKKFTKLEETGRFLNVDANLPAFRPHRKTLLISPDFCGVICWVDRPATILWLVWITPSRGTLIYFYSWPRSS